MTSPESKIPQLPAELTAMLSQVLRPGIEKGIQRGIDRVAKEFFGGASQAQTKPQAQPKATFNEVESLVGDIVQALQGNPAPGVWHHETLVVQGKEVQRVRTGDHDVTGSDMKAEDAAFIAAANPQAINAIVQDWQALRTAAEQATPTQSMASGKVLEKLHSGDSLSDEELTALVQHFRALSPLLTALGPTWALASDAAWRELQRAEDIVRRRGLSVA